MMKKRKGQFQILAAFLVVSILSAAVMTSYYRIQENTRVEPVKVSNAVGEVNLALWKLLGFATGYFSSIIKVTGDYEYAVIETQNYLEGGLTNIAQSHPDWGVSFAYTPTDLVIDSHWFNATSYTKGDWNVTYSLPTLGLKDLKIHSTVGCNVTIIKTEEREPIPGNKTYWSHVIVKMDDRINLQLASKNFQFFKYDSVKNTWIPINLIAEPVLTADGVYQLKIPAPIVDPQVYYLQVEDQRGIITQAGYVQGVAVAGGWKNKAETNYIYSLDWGTTNPNALFTLELLQNGTVRWLGHRLEVSSIFNSTSEKPIPPIPVKSIRVSKSTNNRLTWASIPFQVEDWSSNYQVPQGLTNSKTIFNENCMVVFQIDPSYTDVKLWWDGKSSTQPLIQYSNFTDNTATRTLNNRVIKMEANLSGGSKEIKTTIPASGTALASVQATFFRFNDPTSITNTNQVYGSDLSFVITNGIVRDVIQQEPEFSGGISGSPDTLTHVVITLPADTTYYTYKLRALFLATTQTRTLSELNVIRIDPWASLDSYSPKTENGTFPLSPPSTATYLSRASGSGIHRWSELINAQDRGAGILMHDSSLDALYMFDFDAPNDYRGSVRNSGSFIEINPVRNGSIADSFQVRKDITWNGAVVLFDGTASNSPIVTNGNLPGLSLMVDEPPNFTFIFGS